jgi:FAD/FMN-containing dehydrogenase
MKAAGKSFRPLPEERLTRLDSWAMVDHSMAYVYRPSTLEGICDVLASARETGRSIVPRGSGYSYGDAALNAENIALDLSRMNRVVSWDPRAGVIKVEPGVTIGQVWRYVLEDGWWPPVVPGSMYPTVGGCAATNVHGKNNWRDGTLGDWIEEISLLLPSGVVKTCNRDENPELYYAAIGGLGMLGIIVGVTMRLKRVSSGLLLTQQYAVRSLAEMHEMFANLAPASDYLVGWIDGFAGNASLGRGLVQAAGFVGDDPAAAATLRPSFQDLPDTIFGVVPRSRAWMAMKLVANDAGMRGLNAGQYLSGVIGFGRERRVPHARYHFFLDYIPHFKWAFRPYGIEQYQVFLPHGQAEHVFVEVLRRSQEQRLVPYLAVVKLHQEEDFLLRYNTDGYSLALDYRATPGNLTRLRRFLTELTDGVVLPAGGRLYPAKDTIMRPDHVRKVFGNDAVDRFLALKCEIDPERILQSEMYRRYFP